MDEHTDSPAPLIPFPSGSLAEAGEAASAAASRHRFQDYRLRRAEHTLRRQSADLALFAAFLAEIKVRSGDLASDPQAWRGVTWGLVEAFVKWQLQQGYSVSSVNVRLSTVKTYARLAMQSGMLSTAEYALMRAVQGYSRAEQRRVDQRRPQTRRGLKKAVSVPLTAEKATALKSQPVGKLPSPQGRRDILLMCLLLDHGLRAGELAALAIDELDLAAGLLRFFRPKVGKEQVHRMSADTLRAVQACVRAGELLPSGALLRSSRKDGSLGKAGMSERAISRRVEVLGERLGVFGLSAHDCRHHWATSAAQHGTDPFALQEAGGWSSLAMPRRYVEDNQIANQGVKLSDA
jgi:integrase